MTLVVFDFDGTLSESDLTVLLGQEYDVENEVQGLVDQSRTGEAAFADTLRQRIALLDGMPEERVEAAFERAKLRDGVADLLAALNRSDVTTAIVTGGIEDGVRAALDRAGVGVDHLVANRLVVENGAVAGVEGPLLERGKDAVLEELVATADIDPSRTVAVGNDATDLPMLRLAGTAIGFEPEPLVEEACDVVVTSVRKLRLYFEQHGVIETGG